MDFTVIDLRLFVSWNIIDIISLSTDCSQQAFVVAVVIVVIVVLLRAWPNEWPLVHSFSWKFGRIKRNKQNKIGPQLNNFPGGGAEDPRRQEKGKCFCWRPLLGTFPNPENVMLLVFFHMQLLNARVYLSAHMLVCYHDLSVECVD